jgi:hypothetical protein
VFSPEERERLRGALVASAEADNRLTGAALTGSAALSSEDQWSDIDLAFGVSDGADLGRVIGDWSDRMYDKHGAVHHMDMHRGPTVYRVFLLSSTLQVDIAFSPASNFGAIAPSFKLLFGTTNDLPEVPAPTAARLIGMGWLYALHARSAIARERVWQAEYMISGMRDHVLDLSCVRHGLPATQGRGTDGLPIGVTAAIAGALVRSLEISELRRAFLVITEAFLAETRYADAALARRLEAPLSELAGSPAPHFDVT